MGIGGFNLKVRSGKPNNKQNLTILNIKIKNYQKINFRPFLDKKTWFYRPMNGGVQSDHLARSGLVSPPLALH